jgi:hypothetical protein
MAEGRNTVRGTKAKRKGVRALRDWGMSERTGGAFLYPVSIARLFNQDYPLWNGAPNEGVEEWVKHAPNGYLVYYIWSSVMHKENEHPHRDRKWHGSAFSDDALPFRCELCPSSKVDSNAIVVQRNAVQPTLIHISSTFGYAPHTEENTLAGGTKMVHGNRLLNVERACQVSIVRPSSLYDLSKG